MKRLALAALLTLTLAISAAAGDIPGTTPTPPAPPAPTTSTTPTNPGDIPGTLWPSIVLALLSVIR